jgi:hypothetical protein
MRKMITRTIITTTVNSATVAIIDGKATTTDYKPLIFNGVVKEKDALKDIRKAYGENAIVVSKVETESEYEISVDDFIKYAKKVEPKEGEKDASKPE